MKNLKIKVCLLLFISILSCGESNTEPAKFTLIVNNGTGGGQYAAGTQVTVTANDPPNGKEFDLWEGDSDLLTDKQRSQTTLIMPSGDVILTAVYRDIDIGDPIALTIDQATTFQTIDGFGFFGAYDVWWNSANNMWNDAWGEKVINDLGITIWRNEYFPPAIPGAAQDADWTKQKPVVDGLKAKADKYRVYLKFIFTVWSPPADLKWQSNFTWPGDENATRNEGTVSTKNGGTLNPNKYTEFANWIKEGIQLYKDSDIDVYALSLQNEPMFTQTFNSCTYTFTWYNDLLTNVVPKIKTEYPDVKIFGSEHMLDMEGADINWPYFYHANIKANSQATANVDIFGGTWIPGWRGTLQRIGSCRAMDKSLATIFNTNE